MAMKGTPVVDVVVENANDVRAIEVHDGAPASSAKRAA